MKKVILVICVCLLSLSSCEKKYCWQCQVFSLINNKVDDTFTQCDKTEAEMQAAQDHDPADSFYLICSKR
jgi:hypothetical protein